MNSLKNDILKIKIVRDLNKHQVYRHNDNYSSLLTLFKNNHIGTKKTFTINNINDKYLIFIKNIIKLSNIKIISNNIFSHFTLEKDKTLKNKIYNIYDEKCDVLKTIIKNNNDLFFIFKIDEKNAKWFQLKGHLTMYNRKIKIKKLSNLS